jgi:hypothetical protein
LALSLWASGKVKYHDGEEVVKQSCYLWPERGRGRQGSKERKKEEEEEAGKKRRRTTTTKYALQRHSP